MKKILLGITAITASGVAQAQNQNQAQTQTQDRPNILFICIDDLRTELGAYGSKEVITPNLDKLASEGRLFTHQYVQAPTSGASRGMLLTGIGARVSGDVDNFGYSNKLYGSVEQEHPESFIHHLRRNGYHTVGMGKISHSDNGYTYKDGDKRLELPYSWDEFINDPNSPWPDKFDARLHGSDNGGTRIVGESPAFEFKDLADECYADGELANLALTRLERLAQNPNSEPFFMAVGFYKPHLPFNAPKKYWDMYENTEISLSPNPEYPKGVDQIFVPNSAECFNTYYHPEKGGAGIVLSNDYSKDLRRAYYSALTFTDAQVGKVLDKLSETGLDKNTIVIVWGDHGWHLGDQTIWGKHSVFERALKSAFMVRCPEMQSQGESSNQLIAAVDIYPTICELTGIETPDGLDGVSFATQLDSPKATGREYVVSYWNSMISVRNKRYRFSLYNQGKKSAMMLFDHKNDPFETVNVVDKNPKLVEYFMEIIKNENHGYLPNI